MFAGRERFALKPPERHNVEGERRPEEEDPRRKMYEVERKGLKKHPHAFRDPAGSKDDLPSVRRLPQVVRQGILLIL